MKSDPVGEDRKAATHVHQVFSFAEEDIGGSIGNWFRRNTYYVVFCVIAAIVFEGILLSHGVGRESFVYVLALLFWLSIIGYSSFDHDPIPSVFLRRFAKENGFSYLPGGDLKERVGALFKVGSVRSITNVVQGEYDGVPISIFNYSYVTGPTKLQKEHNFTVFDFQLSSGIPDILLESVENGFGFSLRELTQKKLSQVKLEGNFAKYFSLGIEQGYEIEALQVFAPDIMAALIDKGGALSIEITNEHLLVYAAKIAYSKRGFLGIFGIVGYFTKKIIPILSRASAGDLIVPPTKEKK